MGCCTVEQQQMDPRVAAPPVSKIWRVLGSERDHASRELETERPGPKVILSSPHLHTPTSMSVHLYYRHTTKFWGSRWTKCCTLGEVSTKILRNITASGEREVTEEKSHLLFPVCRNVNSFSHCCSSLTQTVNQEKTRKGGVRYLRSRAKTSDQTHPGDFLSYLSHSCKKG